jgi:hypothetical protein
MGILTEWITEWLKELLISGIMDNLEGLFDTVNTVSGKYPYRWERPRRHGTPGFSP